MLFFRLKKAVVIFSTLALISCQMTPIEQEKRNIQRSFVQETRQSKINTEPFSVPAEVVQALKPKPFQFGRTVAMPRQNRFDIAANSVDIQPFFANLVEKTPYSVAFHPELSGSVSLQLKQVTLDEVIDSITQLYDYRIIKKGRIIQVLPAQLMTEIFNVNYLLLKRIGVSQTSISSGGLTERGTGSDSSGNSTSSSSSSANGTYIESRTETDFWSELETTLGKLLPGEGRHVVISPQAGVVSVRGFPNEISAVKEFLKRAERNVQRQVILEARIIEVTLHDAYQQGIEWQEILTSTGRNNVTNFDFSTSSANVSDVISSTLGGVASVTFSNVNFSGIVTLLKTQGDVNVLSSPRITALNNQKAVIKVGQDEYFVTDVSSTTSSVGDNVINNPDIELTPFFSGVALDVTPQIDENGQVLLHVHPSVTNVVEQQKVIELQSGVFQLPLANSSIRETDTIIRAKSGDVVVIGGLMSSRTTERVSKVPLLGDIPILGELFTNRYQQIDKTELIILIRPTVVGQGTWQRQLEQSKQLVDSWYPATID